MAVRANPARIKHAHCYLHNSEDCKFFLTSADVLVLKYTVGPRLVFDGSANATRNKTLLQALAADLTAMTNQRNKNNNKSKYNDNNNNK